MLGSFQQATLRVEVAASAATLTQCLTHLDYWQRGMWPLPLHSLPPEHSLPPKQELQVGTRLRAGWIPFVLEQRVESLKPDQLRLILWGVLDGFGELAWGNGWVQLRVEGVTVLPLAVLHSLLLKQLKDMAESLERHPDPAS